ncbi:hypothetical protein GGR51DRAFT_566591 [Nemania sp. FL0031]|nr:hypothetical protein GGR51DRAFT_566591 [Nemania sp. FL0031]
MMNAFAAVTLLAGGATAASSMSSAATTAAVSSNVNMVASSATAAAVTAYSKPAETPSANYAMGNGSAPVWAYYNVTVTSVVVVQELTTLCQEATTLTYNGCEYPATKGQLVTVTNCPCTVTTTIPTLTSSKCPPGVTPTLLPPGPPGNSKPAPPSTPTVVAPAGYPSSTPSVVQVGGAAPTGSGNAIGFIVAAAALAFGI